MDEVVKSGKVLLVVVSDFPAWEVARATTYADDHALSRIVSYTGRCSLVDQAVERDVLPMCRKFS